MDLPDPDISDCFCHGVSSNFRGAQMKRYKNRYFYAESANKSQTILYHFLENKIVRFLLRFFQYWESQKTQTRRPGCLGKYILMLSCRPVFMCCLVEIMMCCYSFDAWEVTRGGVLWRKNKGISFETKTRRLGTPSPHRSWYSWDFSTKKAPVQTVFSV